MCCEWIKYWVDLNKLDFGPILKDDSVSNSNNTKIFPQ